MLDIDKPKSYTVRHWKEFLYNEHFVPKNPTEDMSVKPKRISVGALKDVEKKKRESLSLLSKLTRILIAANLLPVSLNSDQTRARFSLFSLKTASYLLVAYSPFLLFGANFLFPSNYLMEYAGLYPEIYSPFDMVWILFFTIGSNIVAPLWMLIVADAFCSLTEISLSKRLAMFNNNILLHVSVITVLVTTGYCLTYYGHYLAVDQSLKQFGSRKSFLMFFGYIATSIYACGFCYSLPLWLVLAWITNTRIKFESKNQGKLQ